MTTKDTLSDPVAQSPSCNETSSAALWARLQNFVAASAEAHRSVVLISSGGTTVPLEAQTVRYIDNFSSGNRGAASAEYFLKKGFAVIFLHRARSLKPFERQLASVGVLDLLERSPDGNVNVRSQYAPLCEKALRERDSANAENRLAYVEFVSVSEYLLTLEQCCKLLEPLGKNAVLYLAAAVSDFYIPSDQLPEHKIQSSGGPLQLSLRLVPKMLKPLVSKWVPKAFVVSFKLETDPSLLMPKAKSALATYHHQLVIGNILHTRRTEVFLITDAAEMHIMLTPTQVATHVDLEELIVDEIAKRHSVFACNEPRQSIGLLQDC